ncbi:MAG: adenine-specific methyltransferase EcoRI family protein [Anaerolineaceae bacterium]
MANDKLSEAKKAKKDEFYTQYNVIEKEISAYLEYDPDVFRGKIILLPCDDPEWSNFTKYFAQNFERFGLRKLISTSFAAESNTYKGTYQPTLFETSDPQYDQNKTTQNGKIFTLTSDRTGDQRVNVDDLEWHYLEGDGDFRSREVQRLQEESDIIITNPPFSLFREFLAWIMEAGKQFVIIGNMNAITYKEVFPLIKENKMWLGPSITSGDREFQVPDDYPINAAGWRIDENGRKYLRIKGVRWFTNLDHGRRHQPLPLMTVGDNLKFSKHKEIKGKQSYDRYDNYDGIEVPYTDSIPSDFEGVMGVPISFLDKYNPDQFEILGATQRGCHDEVPDTKKYDEYWEVRQNGEKTGSSGGKTNENANLIGNDGKKNYFINKDGRIIQSAYQRIFIQHRRGSSL